MKGWVTLILGCFAIYANAATDSVRIEGVAPEYAGMTLIVETTTQFMLHESSEVTRMQVKPDGQFNGAFATESPLQCTILLGRMNGTFYVEPCKTYQLALPPYQPRSDADRFNPFFEPEEVILGVINIDNRDFNERINAFEIDFEANFNAYAVSIFNQANVPLTRKICHAIDSIHPAEPQSYFEIHKRFRYARLYALAMKRQRRQMIDQYFSNTPVPYRMPAYWDSFNEVFKDFFSYYFQTPSGRQLRLAFNEGKPYDTLSQVLKTDTLFVRDDFREAVLARALYDAFYSKRYEEERIIDLMKQAVQSSQSSESKYLTSRMDARINQLRVGTESPLFEAFNSAGKYKSLDEYRGKFVYLNFMHTQNYACKKQMQALAAIARELKRDLVVLTILTDEKDEMAFEYIKQNEYKWEILHFGGNGKILSDYNIKAMPTYYLIDPDGFLSLSPAPAPEESFAIKFTETLRNFKSQKERKNPDKQRSIYDM